MKHKRRWLVVVTYAAAMAWVEAAVVFYLRTMVDRIEPHQVDPLPVFTGFGLAELTREAATLIMLAMVGLLAGRCWRSRLGFAAIAFGVWDIFYYVFLKVLCGWPRSLLDWDILFLLPLPWWGPVLAPVSIAMLLILWGTLVSTWDVPKGKPSVEWTVWAMNFAGIVFVLYLFMADTLRAAGGGVDAVRKVVPERFNWAAFAMGLAMMAAPVAEVIWRLARTKRPETRALDYAKWLEHFTRNREHRPEPDWSSPVSLERGVYAPLLKSLEQFQLGDGGGPASLIARDAAKFRDSTREMRALVDLWFTEEREHSRLLGCAVDALGGKRIQSHWSFSAFCACRRVLGVRFELQVLLLTEITSTAYYRLLQRHSPIPAMAAMCALILRDEAGHISFHRDRLASKGRSVRGLAGRAWAAQFVMCGYAAATMLWVNHGKCLTRLGGSTREFYGEVRLELKRFLRKLAPHFQFQLAMEKPSGDVIRAAAAARNVHGSNEKA